MYSDGWSGVFLWHCNLWPVWKRVARHRTSGRATSDADAIIAAVWLDRWEVRPLSREDSDYPNKRPSKVLSDHQLHPHPLLEHKYRRIARQSSSVWMQFCEWLQQQDVAVELFFTYTKFCRETKRVLRDRVYSMFMKVTKWHGMSSCYSQASLNDGDSFWEMRRYAISSLCERHTAYLHKPRQYILLHI
jgi:hypothetical protein